MSDYPGILEQLYARHALISTGRADGDSRLVHTAIIERLAANRRVAEGEGWTSLKLERLGGMGRLELRGVPAAAELREVVPDWAPRQPAALLHQDPRSSETATAPRGEETR